MKSILITGANSGVGFEAARSLALKGEHVILAVRNKESGEKARNLILLENANAKVDIEIVDLNDLDSVRALAAKPFHLDVLINNAGIGSGPLQLTKEGVNLVFGTNHLGHFLLTALLLPRLEMGTDPRVVTISSRLGLKGKLDLDNLDGSKSYWQAGAYVQSKLANSLFAGELDRRLRANGSKVKVLLRTLVQLQPKWERSLKAFCALFRSLSPPSLLIRYQKAPCQQFKQPLDPRFKVVKFMVLERARWGRRFVRVVGLHLMIA